MINNIEFERYNALVNIMYFLVVMFVTMFFKTPVVLFIVFLSSSIMVIYFKGINKYFLSLIKFIPMMILIIFLNFLVNHQGQTILFYLNDNPITKEAIYYGFYFSFMILNMFLVFISFNLVMTSDKIISVFSRIIPIFSLMFALTLRFVPRYKKEYENIKCARSMINMGSKNGNFIERIRNTSLILSSLISYAIEDSMDIALSMVSRGFLIGNRSSYKNEKMTKNDKICIFVMFVLLGIIFFGIKMNVFYMIFFPVIEMSKFNILSIFCYLALFLFSFLPIFIQIREDIVWKSLKQKI